MSTTTTAPTTAELVAALRALVESEGDLVDVYSSGEYTSCPHCGYPYGRQFAKDGPFRHAPECVGMNARDLLARLDATEASGEEGA